MIPYKNIPFNTNCAGRNTNYRQLFLGRSLGLNRLLPICIVLLKFCNVPLHLRKSPKQNAISTDKFALHYITISRHSNSIPVLLALHFSSCSVFLAYIRINFFLNADPDPGDEFRKGFLVKQVNFYFLRIRIPAVYSCLLLTVVSRQFFHF